MPSVNIDGPTVAGWASAKLLERVLSRITVPRVTSADVLTALWSVKNDVLDGLTYPLTFDEGAHNYAVHERSCCYGVDFDADNRTV